MAVHIDSSVGAWVDDIEQWIENIGGEYTFYDLTKFE
jgi:hypothetical protein